MSQHDAPREAGLSRRRFLGAAGAAGACFALPGVAFAAREPSPARLAFEHLHTGETLSLRYPQDRQEVAEVLQRVSRVLRDHYSGDLHPIHPGLVDLLFAVQRQTGSHAPFQVISGYRSRRTNERLRAQGRGVGRRSMHLEGKAIDIRLADVPSTTLRDVAWKLQRGGVGFYPKSDFVHMDVGRVRRW